MRLGCRVLLGWGLMGCSHDDDLRQQIDDLYYAEVSGNQPYQDQLRRLRELVGGDTKQQDLVEDAKESIQALLLAQQGLYVDAIQHWQSILARSGSELHELAFRHWVTDLGHAFGAKIASSRNRLSKSKEFLSLVSSELQRLNPTFYTKHGFSDAKVLLVALQRIAGQNPERRVDLRSQLPRSVSVEDCPQWEIDPSAGPCFSDYRQWFSRVKGHWRRSIAFGKSSQEATMESGRQVVQVARYTGDRENIAWAMDSYAEVLSSKVALHDAFTSVYEKIDILLWSARYEALLGHMIAARRKVDEAVRFLSHVYLSRSDFSKEQRAQLVVLRAEACLVMAHRILVEEKQYLKAYQIAAQMADMDQLPLDWRLRLLWYSGLYAYVDGYLQQAEAQWRLLLAEDQKGQRQDQVLFWLMRLKAKTGDLDQAGKYGDALAHSFPYSFYTVVAPIQAQLQNILPPSEVLNAGVPIELAESELGILEQDEPYSSLRMKAELLLAAGSPEIAGEIAVLLGEKVKAQLKPSRQSVDEYLYVAKILLVAEQPVKALQMAQKIYPFLMREQKIAMREILFAKPFARAYGQAASNSGVPLPLLWAISRQESLFDPAAISPAQAYGLMQLILPTARRFGEWDLVAEDLLDPATNISLGARYLQFLRSYFPEQDPLVYAAYNAGEFAVNHWRRRRFWQDALLMVEMIPFAETRQYTQKVWRNYTIYQALDRSGSH